MTWEMFTLQRREMNSDSDPFLEVTVLSVISAFLF